ncbi:MAG: hypothetical protein V1746_04975 [bacterium]
MPKKFLETQWHDIRGNVKWALLYWGWTAIPMTSLLAAFIRFLGHAPLWHVVVILCAPSIFAYFVCLMIPKRKTATQNNHPVADEQPKQNVGKKDNKKEQKQEERIWIKRNFCDLVKPFEKNSKLSNYQAQKLVSDYIGKWWQFKQPLLEMSECGENFFLLMFLPPEKGARGFIKALFDKNDEKYISHFSRGDEIDISGKISEIDSFGIKLENCEVNHDEP